MSGKSKVNNNPKSIERMDRVFSNKKFFKKKDLRYTRPYTRELLFSVASETYKLPKSSKSQSLRNGRNRYNRTAQSTKETRGGSDVKSSFNHNKNTSEYSFYDRGFKEYEYNPLKTRIRPMTAGVQRENNLRKSRKKSTR